MAQKVKRSYKVYPAWEYMGIIEDLNTASDKGWQLVKGGVFRSRFVKNPDIRCRYQMDYQKVEDMGRYIETFREQGWEYVNSTFNGWHFFRKLYDPSLPEEEYEIFTDRESLNEMRRRWSKVATGLGLFIGIFALVFFTRMILHPNLPALVQMLLMAIESVVLLCGAVLIRKPDSKRNHRASRLLFMLFLCVIVFGTTGSILLTDMRPFFNAEQNAEELAEPMHDNRWVDFDVKYPDNYYLNLDMDGTEPFSFEIVNA